MHVRDGSSHRADLGDLSAVISNGSERIGGHSAPIAEQGDENVVHPVSLMALSDFRSSTDYTLFWPDNITELKPNSCPGDSEQCWKTFEQCGRMSLITSSAKSTLHGIALQARQRPNDPIRTNDYVAVKVISVKKLSDPVADDRAVKSALHEFQQLSKIRHCHIIAALDMFQFTSESPRQQKIIMLLYPKASRDLDDHLSRLSDSIDDKRRKSFACAQPVSADHPIYPSDASEENSTVSPVDRLLGYFPCLCQALLYLHNFVDLTNDSNLNPIKHRDIKPHNILIDRFHQVLLADFDISKQYQSYKLAGTHGLTDRTIAYAAPTLNDMRNPRSFEMDVISLGFVFLEMMTVILGISRHVMFRFLPPYKQDTRVNHSDALTTKKTHEWVKHLEQTISLGVPTKLEGGAAGRMIEQVMKMMNAKYEAEGVLQEAYECFREIADPCKHCGRDSGNEVRIRTPHDANPPVTEQSSEDSEQSERPGHPLGERERDRTGPYAFVESTALRHKMLDYEQLLARCGEHVYEYLPPTMFNLKATIERKETRRFKRESRWLDIAQRHR